MNNKFRIKDLSDFPSTTGVYSIGFDGGNKLYIGSASSESSKIKSGNGFYNRWRKHIHQLKNNKHHSPALQNAFNKYGEDKLFFNIIELCESKNCTIKEQYYIDFYNSFNKGYNGRPNASSNLGYKQSEEHKNKIKSKYKTVRDIVAKDVIRLYNENKTTRQIAHELKISRNYIKKIFQENNIKGKNRAFYNKKKLYQYNLDGILIKEWDNIRECANSLDIAPVSIRFVLNKKCKQASGFYFSLENLNKDMVLDNINNIGNWKPRIKSKKYINIKQFDECDNYLKVWKDIREIMNYYNIPNNSSILNAIKNNKKYKEFYWRI